jgi:hypothetical protein
MNSEINRTDTVNNMLRELWEAGKEHRLVAERIDALAPDSKAAWEGLYLTLVEQVRKAIEDLRDNQERLRLESQGINTLQLDATLRDLLHTAL